MISLSISSFKRKKDFLKVINKFLYQRLDEEAFKSIVLFLLAETNFSTIQLILTFDSV